MDWLAPDAGRAGLDEGGKQMTDDDIKRLRRLAEQATPGPWRVNMKGHSYHEVARVNDLEVAPPDSVEQRLGMDGAERPPTPVGWSDTDWIKYLQEQDEQPHPLAGQHINQGSMDAAADAYEAEYNAAMKDGKNEQPR
jgi:uncharacterized protein YndB with AHSA1/START domain